MSDYIKRDDIIKALGELCDTPAGQSTGLTALVYAAKTIEELPAADVVERKKGEWVFANSIRGYRCSLCKAQAPFWCMTGTQDLSNFCPNCGAEMVNGGDEA